MARQSTPFFAIMLAALATAPAVAGDDYGFPALLDRITDLDSLTVPPAAGVRVSHDFVFAAVQSMRQFPVFSRLYLLESGEKSPPFGPLAAKPEASSGERAPQ